MSKNIITMTRDEFHEMEKRFYIIHSLAVMLEIDRAGNGEIDAFEQMNNGTSHVISNIARLIQGEAEALIKKI